MKKFGAPNRKNFDLPPVTTEYCHIATKVQLNKVLGMIDNFYGGGPTIEKKPKVPAINLKNIKCGSRKPESTIERLAGEGGEKFSLEKAYGEELNQLLLSHRSDPFFESKLKAHTRNSKNKTQIQKYLEMIQRKMSANFQNQGKLGATVGTYTHGVVDGNIDTLKDQLE